MFCARHRARHCTLTLHGIARRAGGRGSKAYCSRLQNVDKVKESNGWVVLGWRRQTSHCCQPLVKGSVGRCFGDGGKVTLGSLYFSTVEENGSYVNEK
jgi:hypothetical protein